MGKFTVRFKCHHCGHCCTDVVCLPTPWDVIQLVKNTGFGPDDFLEFISPDEISEVAKSDPTWLRCNGRRYMMALRRGKNGCFFRDPKNGFCKAYAWRPILCMLFPFRLHETRRGKFKAFSLHREVGCLKHRDDVHPTQRLYDLYLEDREHQEDYADLVAVFNRDKSDAKKPEDFIELFITGSKARRRVS